MKKSNHITYQGWQALDQELKFLWKQERPRITQAVSEAAALGDRSENAEYIYGKKRLREIDRRVRFLMKRLDEVIIVHPEQQKQLDKVFFGAWVTLVDENDQQVTYRIVGADEFDPKKNWISVNSPMARALIGKSLDDEVVVKVPGGERVYDIVAIRYVEEDEQ